MVQANYAYAFGRKTWRRPSLREDWFYIDSGAGSDHTFKANWHLSNCRSARARRSPPARAVGQRPRSAGGNWRPHAVAVGSEVQLRRLPPGGHERAGTAGHVQVLPPHGRQRRSSASTCCPEDVITNSILALFTYVGRRRRRAIRGALPTGRYLAPANGPDCVTYAEDRCPGTAVTRFITGPGYFKSDLSVVKRILMAKRHEHRERVWTSSTCSIRSTSRRPAAWAATRSPAGT